MNKYVTITLCFDSQIYADSWRTLQGKYVSDFQSYTVQTFVRGFPLLSCLHNRRECVQRTVTTKMIINITYSTLQKLVWRYVPWVLLLVRQGRQHELWLSAIARCGYFEVLQILQLSHHKQLRWRHHALIEMSLMLDNQY